MKMGRGILRSKKRSKLGAIIQKKMRALNKAYKKRGRKKRSY